MMLKITSIKFPLSIPFPQDSVDTCSVAQLMAGNCFAKLFATVAHDLPSFQPLILGS